MDPTDAEHGGSHIQQPSQGRPDLKLLESTPQEAVSYLTLLRNGNFRRFFLAQFVSSLGDWVGVVAIAVFARSLGGDTAVGAVMTARVLPGFLMGPIGGVLADRWDRKKTMVIADVLRAGIIFSLPFVPNLIYLLIASVALESLTLIWGPAKDASLPHFVPTGQLTHANSLTLMAIYGTLPLGTVVFAGLATVGSFFADNVPVLSGLAGNEEGLALWVDSLTFLFSAMMISSLAITSSKTRATKFDLGQAKRDLVEGLAFVVRHKQVRPWLIGIGFTFTAAGGVFSLGVGFVETVLGGGERGFAFLVGFLGTGLILGLLAAGFMVRHFQKDVLFPSSLLLLGLGLIALASAGNLEIAIPIASALGFFAGVAYSTGYSLMQETSEDELRGRTFSAAYTVIRVGTLVGLGLFPFIAGAVGDLAIGDYPVPGTRLTLWVAGTVVFGGGILALRAIKERQPQATTAPREHHGFFVVFEGGEGAGKSTQIEAFVQWLRARGDDVVVTREPGGTAIGERIRELLLDPAADPMDPKAEALLYAADRAQHVADVIRPALERGAVVVSDRFIDSSLAYQGFARGLGVDQILEMGLWATEGLMPDLVFFMDLDPDAGLDRIGEQRDRIEREADEFHRRVNEGYRQLALRFSDRFVVLEASGTSSDIHAEIVAAFEDRAGDRAEVTDMPSETILPR